MLFRSLTSNARAGIAAQVSAVPFGELVVWAQTERTQFRVRGKLEIIRENEGYLESWHGLSDRDRAMFFWPDPGTPFSSAEKKIEIVPVSTPPPKNFLALVLRATEAEALELNEFPHKRRLWQESSDWKLQLINP